MARKNYSASITIGGAIGSSFRAAVGGAQADIAALGKSIKSLNSAQASLSKGKGVVDFDALKKSRQAMRDAEASVAKLNQEIGATKRPTREQVNALAAAQVAATKAKQKYDTLRASQLATVRAVRAATGSYRTNAQTVERLGKASQEAAAKVDRLRRSSERFAGVGSAITRVGQAFRGVGDSMRGLAVTGGSALAAILGPAAAIGSVAKSFSDAGDDIAAVAFSIGMTNRALQQFRYIGTLNNVTTDEMDQALRKLSSRLAKTIDPSDGLNEELRKLGLGLSAARLRALGPEKAMIALSMAMQRTEDPARRLALAIAVFGERAGPRMVNVLAQGPDGMRALAKEAVQLGYVMSEDAVKGAQDLDTAFKRASATVTALRNTIGEALAPVVMDLLGEFNAWVKENREEITKSARAFGEWAKENGPKFVTVVKEVAVAVRDVVVVIDSVITKTIGWDNAVKVVSGVLGGVVIGQVIAFGVAVWGVVAAIGALPLAIGAAVAAVAWLGYTVWKYWDQLPAIASEALTQTWEAIKVAAVWWKEVLTEFFVWLGKKWVESLDYIPAIYLGKKAVGAAGAAWDWAVGNEPTPTTTVPGNGLPAAAPGAAIGAPTGALPTTAPAAVSAAGGAASAPVSIVVNGAQGQDPKAIVAEVVRRLNDIDRVRARGALND